MVATSVVKTTNTTVLPSTLPQGLVAVFLGATAGIGLNALKQFAIAADGKSPHIYIIGRSHTAATPLIAEVRQSNSSATVEFIEKDVSLLKQTDEAMNEVIKRETKVDYLFSSVGFLTFEGRNETSEGLAPTMTTRCYTRIRSVELLLPLLNKSENPHVVNVLAGGLEGKIVEDDLDLKNPKNFTIANAALQTATMLTLTLERFAKENPKISFVHFYPGLVATDAMNRAASGFLGVIMRYFLVPILNTFFALKPADVGARLLFYATNARYSVDSTASLCTPIPQGLTKAKPSAGGIWLLNEKGESVDNEKVLSEMRGATTEKVWDHVQAIFRSVQ